MTHLLHRLNPVPSLISFVRNIGLQGFMIMLFSITALVLAAVSLFDSPEMGLSLGMLYSLANDGKLSGRADGNVYMRNGRIRGMKVPRLVQNNATQRVRSAFGTFSSAWRALTQTQQNSWIDARGFFTTDRFGRTVELTGKALYNMLNQNLFLAGSSPISTAPAPDAVAGITSLGATFTLGPTAASLTFTPSPTDANTTLLVEATSPQGSGINRPGRGAFRSIGILDPATASPASVTSLYTARFNTPVSGQKVFFRVTAINNTTGQAAAPVIASVQLA